MPDQVATCGAPHNSTLGVMNLATAAVAISIGSWTLVPGGSWSPSSEDLTEVRSRIEPFVKVQAAANHRELPAWSRYSFQYQGRSEGERKVIFVNAFCITPPPYAREQFVFVFDGGPCFFNLKYDPQKKQFFDLMFNGHA